MTGTENPAILMQPTIFCHFAGHRKTLVAYRIVRRFAMVPMFTQVLGSLIALSLVLLCPLTGPLCAEESSASLPAEEEFFSGYNLLSKGHLHEAVPVLEKAVQLDPENVRYREALALAYNNLGLKMGREGNVQEGVSFLAKALNVVPANADIQHNFVQTVFQAVSVSEEIIPIEQKMTLLKEVIEIEPKNVTAQKFMAVLLNNEGVAKGRTGNHEEEIVQLDRASSLDPKNTKIRKNLSNAYYNMALKKGKANNFHDAVNDLRRALELSPEDQLIIKTLAGTLSNLAVTKGSEGDIRGQISLLKESLQLFPKDDVTKTNLAAAYDNLAMTEDPERTMEQRIRKKAAKVAPENASVQTSLASVYQNEGVEKSEPGMNQKKRSDASTSLAGCGLLNEYLERFVYICFRTSDSDIDSRLASIKKQYRSVIDQMESRGLSTSLVNYEETCRCFNRSLSSGIPLKAVYSKNLCGSVPTKQLRTNLVNKCQGRLSAGADE